LKTIAKLFKYFTPLGSFQICKYAINTGNHYRITTEQWKY